MDIEQKQSPNYNRRPAGTLIDTIVIHCTAGSWQATVNFFMRSGGLSSHYAIRKDGHVAQFVRDADRAWHAGVSTMPDGRTDVNDFSIGIELENANDGLDPYPDVQIEALVELCKLLVSRHPIQARNIVGHADIASARGKTDPRGLDLDVIRRRVFSAAGNAGRLREATEELRDHLDVAVRLAAELSEIQEGR